MSKHYSIQEQFHLKNPLRYWLHGTFVHFTFFKDSPKILMSFIEVLYIILVLIYIYFGFEHLHMHVIKHTL